jgi:hypothetical protein
MTIKINSVKTCALRLRVERKIEALLRELLDLPAEFTPEAYLRWWEIQNTLKGLYDIKRRFLDSPQLDEPLESEELLY